MSVPETRHAIYPGPIEIDGELYEPAEVIQALESQITGNRREAIARVVTDRTWNIVPVLEGIYDYGNMNAVMRSAEALGFQRLHIIQLVSDYKKSVRVAKGAEKWVDLLRWQKTQPCVDFLNDEGFRILAATTGDAAPIGEFAFDEKTAIVFGNERRGLSDEVIAAADDRVCIPMAGFTESFNISVAAALSFYHIRNDRIARRGAHGDLTPDEQQHLTASYYARHLPSAGAIMRRHTVAGK